MVSAPDRKIEPFRRCWQGEAYAREAYAGNRAADPAMWNLRAAFVAPLASPRPRVRIDFARPAL
jgi:hypothetical protein